MKFIKWMIAGALGVILVSTNPAVTRAQETGGDTSPCLSQ
jgi:hypothetical protein